MNAAALFDGSPKSGTFFWLAKLAGAQGRRPAFGDAQLFARQRGSGLETFALSAMAGLAVLGLGFEVARCCLGAYAWLAAVPVAVLGLHLACLVWILIGEGLIRLRIMPRAWQAGLTGLGFAATIAALGAISETWLALPWLAFVVLEAVAYPAKRLWELSDEEGGG